MTSPPPPALLFFVFVFCHVINILGKKERSWVYLINHIDLDAPSFKPSLVENCLFYFILHNSIIWGIKKKKKKKTYQRSSCCGTEETNPTHILEDVAWIPGLGRWVKDSVLPGVVVQVTDAAQILRGCGCGQQLQLWFEPWPGNLNMPWVRP